MLKEFKKFAFKGNMFDLAIGVIIGAAFSKIVSSLVNDLFMPLFGLILGGINFTELSFTLPSFYPGVAPPVLNYGVFIQTIIEFLIIALSVFMFVKIIGFMREKVMKKEEEAEVAEPPAPSVEELLLTEIRDLLKSTQTG